MSDNDTTAESEYFGEHDATPMSPEPGKVIVIVSGSYLTETPKAVLIKAHALTGEDVDAWFPKSQFKRDLVFTGKVAESDEYQVTLFVPTWLVEAKEVEYAAYVPEDWTDYEDEVSGTGQMDLPLNEF